MKHLFTFLAFFFIVGSGYGQTLPNDWTGDTGIDTYQESTIYNGGSNSCKVVVNTGSQSSCDMRNATISVTAGSSYSYSFYIRSSAYVKARVVLEWVGASISYGNYSAISESSFYNVTSSGTVPSGATGVKLGLRFYDQTGFSAPETQYIDDFTFESPTGSALTVSNGDMESWPASYNDESIITESGTEPTNIAYGTYSATSTLTTANSIEVAKFTIKDGGNDGTDTDTKTTKLTAISFTVDNYENLAALAIFDGTNNKAEVTSFSSSTVSFSSLTLEAADESTKDFTLRATYKTKVTDNDNLKFTVSAATADGADGSTFATADAGGAATDDTGNNNKLIVTGDRLAFTTDKPPTNVGLDEDFTVEVEATDAGGSRDLDAINSITLAKASGTGVLSSITGLSSKSLSSGIYSWTDVQYDTEEDFTIEAQSATLTNITSSTITCAAAPVIPDLVISEVADPDDDYKARFVEFYNADNATIDFGVTTFYICKQVNGGSWYDIQLSGTVASGAMFVIATNSTDFYNSYGFNPDQSNGNINGNGDDGYFLYYNGNHSTGTLVDAFGVIDEDGTGKDWGYENRRAVRTDNSKSGSGVKGSNSWNSADWDINAADVADMTPGIKDAGQTLPINMISFSAQNNNNIITLNWQTATEENNDYFTIERSYNAVDFEEVGRVQAVGNSNKTINYSYTDKDVDLSNVVYYRLKQTDYNGTYTYSEIISINAQRTNISLNKAYGIDGNLYFSVNANYSSQASIEIMDVTGKNIFNQSVNIENGIHNYRIALPNYTVGIYLIRISTSNIITQDKLIFR